MTIDNYLQPDSLVRGSDLDDLFQAVNDNMPLGDEETTEVSREAGGSTIRLLGALPESGAAATVSSTHPFNISATTELISISAGKINVVENDQSNSVDYSFPKGEIDISGITSTATIYVYLKCPISRVDGEDLLSKPTLTVQPVNFYQNTEKFPVSDLGNYYLSLGIVYLTVNQDVRSVQFSQLQYTNHIITGPNVHPFKCSSFYNTKGNDTDSDTAVTAFTEKGVVTTQEGNKNVPSVKSSLNTGRSFIRISFTLNQDGFAENYSVTLEVAASVPVNTTTNYHFETAGWNGTFTYNSITENFRSDGIIF